MDARTWNDPAIRRDRWGAGPWDGEPDKAQWSDAATGLPCLAVRNHMGAWCGYVGVAPGHPFHEKGYSDCLGCDDRQCSGYCGTSPDVRVTVHGGLTYAAGCDERPDGLGICHVPAPGEPDNVWWLGFDCNHCDDMAPMDNKYRTYRFRVAGVYRTLAYVQAECAKLAEQLAEIGTRS